MNGAADAREASARWEQYAEKRAAARRAAGLVPPGMVVGLGSGTTADFALHFRAARLDSGGLPGMVGIPTSEKIGAEARRLGIPLPSLNDHAIIDLTIDGADEVDTDWNPITGGASALLLREKIMAHAGRREVIVVDHTKCSPRLGGPAGPQGTVRRGSGGGWGHSRRPETS